MNIDLEEILKLAKEQDEGFQKKVNEKFAYIAKYLTEVEARLKQLEEEQLGI